MEEQLISFETAKLAKEKDFNEPTQSVYGENSQYADIVKVFYGCQLSWPHNITIKEYLDKSKFKELDYEIKFGQDYYFNVIAYAPTQTILQKWFREKHSINISVTHSFQKQKWWFYTEYITTGIKINDGFWYDTYEEALEAGLQQTLEIL